MQSTISKQTRSSRIAVGAAVLAALALGACSDPNAALNEKVAAAEAAAQRAEAAAAKAEKAVAEAGKPKEAPATMDGGPQLAPDAPNPMVPSAQEDNSQQQPPQQ